MKLSAPICKKRISNRCRSYTKNVFFVAGQFFSSSSDVELSNTGCEHTQDAHMSTLMNTPQPPLPRLDTMLSAMFQLFEASPPEENTTALGTANSMYTVHTPRMLFTVTLNVLGCCDRTTCFYQ